MEVSKAFFSRYIFIYYCFHGAAYFALFFKLECFNNTFFLRIGNCINIERHVSANQCHFVVRRQKRISITVFFKYINE